MKNVTYERVGDKLTITVDLSKDFGPSGTGKTIIIASSAGNEDIGDGVRFGLNVYRSKK